MSSFSSDSLQMVNSGYGVGKNELDFGMGKCVHFFSSFEHIFSIFPMFVNHSSIGDFDYFNIFLLN